MYCKNCGKEIDDNAYVCVHCGVKVNNEDDKKIDNPSNLAGAVSCCFPIVGLILYFLWKDEKPNSAKLICKWMIGGIIVWVIIYILFFMLGIASEL